MWSNFYYRIYTEHNVDDTEFAVNEWCSMVQSQYKSVDCHTSLNFDCEYPVTSFTPTQHPKNKPMLKQQALEAALKAGADYLLVS